MVTGGGLNRTIIFCFYLHFYRWNMTKSTKLTTTNIVQAAREQDKSVVCLFFSGFAKRYKWKQLQMSWNQGLSLMVSTLRGLLSCLVFEVKNKMKLNFDISLHFQDPYFDNAMCNLLNRSDLSSKARLRCFKLAEPDFSQPAQTIHYIFFYIALT